MANEILTERRGQALILTFNRPEQGNAMTPDMATQLFNALKLVTTDRAVRAVLLRGKGRHFMDGLDLGLYGGELERGVAAANQMLQPYHSAIREIYTMEKPVIAAVEGNVAGPGFSFMLACDLVIAARGAKFNARFTSYAMTPDGGASFYLPRKVGAAKANEILMLNETFDAEEAHRLALVNRLADDGKLGDEAVAWLDKLAAAPTRAIGGVKKLVQKAFEQDLSAQLAIEHANWGTCSRSFDFREAIKAHFAKREGKYTGA